MVAIVVFTFILGAVIGSFVSAVAYRVPRGISIAGPRSKCPNCDSTIAAYDNVPIVSWIVLRGRCRSCGDSISPRYPIVELVVGALFVAVLLVFEDEPAEIALGMVFVAMLAAITLTDLDQRVIPNAILLVGAVAGIAISVAGLPESLDERAIAAAAAGGLLLVVAFAYPRGMGMGDAKLAAVMGIFLGRAVAPAILIAFLLERLSGSGCSCATI